MPNTSELVKKPDYTTKVTEIENKMPDLPNLSTKADPNTKIVDIKKKIPDTSHVINTQEFNRLIKICFQSCQWDPHIRAHAGKHAGKSVGQHNWSCWQHNKFYRKSHRQKFFFSRLKRVFYFNFCVCHKKSKIVNWTKHSITTIYM